MKKILIIGLLLVTTGCSSKDIDLAQNQAIEVIVQAHNAVAAKLEKLQEATDKALGTNTSKKQEVFRAALATPVPTPAVEAEK